MVAMADVVTPTMTELMSPSVRRASRSTAPYQRSDGPLKGGMGNSVPWNEYSTSTPTGRKMNP